MTPNLAIAAMPTCALHRAPPLALSLDSVRAWAGVGASELTAGMAAPSLPAEVVWDFDDQSAMSRVPGDRSDHLRRSLSENLSPALLQVPGLPVVKSRHLSDLLAEQKLGSSALADNDARPVFSDEITVPLDGMMQEVQELDRRQVHADGRSHPAVIWNTHNQALALSDAAQPDAAVPALQALLASQPDFGPAARELVALSHRLARR